MGSETIEFSKLFSTPQKNGLTRPKRVRGAGLPMVNMGELFSHSRISNVEMDLVPVSDREGSFLLQPGDLLFARQSLVLEGAGKCSIFVENKKQTVFESHIIRCRLDTRKADPSYYYYFFQSPQGRSVIEQIVEQGAGAAGIRGSDLARLNVPYPEIGSQRIIASVLSAFDDRIDNLRQANATLEAIAQALFKSWFVDFDPVRAKAEGREPEGMDAATANLFPDSLVDSELGAIPEGWQIEQIGDLVDCLGGGTPSTKNEAFWDGGEHHWATPKDLSGLQAPVLSSTARKITGAGVARISSGLLPAGTLLMSSRAPIGYLAIAAVPTAINQGFIAIPPGGALPPAYLLFWAKANMGRIKQKANGSTFMEISRQAFRPIQVLVPPPEILAAFMATVSPVLDRIKANERHRATLAKVRDTLLPRLISGRLRLPEIADGV